MYQEIIEKFADFPENYTKEDDLQTLQSFVHAFVSQDIAYKGDNAFQYSQYYCFAQDFIDKYQGLNTFTAAKNGYDCYIKNVASIDEINSAYEHGMYPLHIASLNGHVHTVLSLISKQANPLVYNNLKQLPLHCSLFSPITHPHSKEIIFSTLVGLEPNSIFEKDMRGNTIFHYMAMYGLNNLLNTSLQHNTEGVFIWNNLHRYPIHEAICNNKLDCVKLMLNIQGVDCLSDNYKRTILHYCAMYGNFEVVEYCFAIISDLNAQDTYGKTALMLAIESNNIEAFKELIHHNVDINKQDSEGKTALHIAVINENFEIIKYLLDSHELIKEIKDVHGKTAESYCTDEGVLNHLTAKQVKGIND